MRLGKWDEASAYFDEVTRLEAMHQGARTHTQLISGFCNKRVYTMKISIVTKQISSIKIIWYAGFCLLWMQLIFGCATSNKVYSTENLTFGDTLSVLTYNIHHANPPSKPGLIDVDAIAEIITRLRPDVVALQEVDVYTNRSGKNLDQAKFIAEKTGMHFYFAKAIDYDNGQYGVAILCRYPIKNAQVYQLPTLSITKGEPRVLATATISNARGRQFMFACTHLDAQRSDTNRILQINKVVEILEKEKLPVILAGDLNAQPGSDVINQLDRYFTRTCVTSCGFTIPEINPIKSIDFIAFSPKEWKVTSHQVIAEPYASDHLPVFATLVLQR